MLNPKNKLETIYQELGDQICLYPFFNGFYQTNHLTTGDSVHNTVRPCSVYLDRSQPQAWNVNTTITESRNSQHWRDIRRAFIEKSAAAVPGCSACSFNQKHGAPTARENNNNLYSLFLSVDIVDEVHKIISNDYCSDTAYSLDYYPSNYCNYSCIMCAGGASSSRMTYENRVFNLGNKIITNDVDPDFYQMLDNVEVINLTGGETILQPEVHALIDYLIEHDLAHKITITLITNASSIPAKLAEKFKLFRNVFYTISIDGVGDIIEYQRRGASWATVEKNAIEVYRNYPSYVNCVITAVNVFGIVDFLQWAEENHLVHICISPVFRELHLTVEAIPPELKAPLIEQITQAKSQVSNIEFLKFYDQVISLLETTKFKTLTFEKFKQHIRREDAVSKKTLVEVVPAWAPYFL